jgi:hypothetical protein
VGDQLGRRSGICGGSVHAAEVRVSIYRSHPRSIEVDHGATGIKNDDLTDTPIGA